MTSESLSIRLTLRQLRHPGDLFIFLCRIKDKQTLELSITLRSWGDREKSRMVFGFYGRDTRPPSPYFGTSSRLLVLQATGGATKAFAGPGDKDAMFDWTPTGAGTLVTYRGIYSFASHAWTLEARWKGGSTTFFSDRPVEFSPSDIGALAITLEHQMPTEGRAGHSKITDISLKIY